MTAASYSTPFPSSPPLPSTTCPPQPTPPSTAHTQPLDSILDSPDTLTTLLPHTAATAVTTTEPPSTLTSLAPDTDILTNFGQTGPREHQLPSLDITPDTGDGSNALGMEMGTSGSMSLSDPSDQGSEEGKSRVSQPPVLNVWY
jgi:hypothetical protein